MVQEHPEDLVVITINRGDDEEAATQYAKQYGYNFLWSIDTNRTQECYASSGIPYDVIIDKNGVVKRIILGSLGDKQYSAMESLIQELNAVS